MKEGLGLNRKETYSGSMLSFIGLFYLMSVSASLFQTSSITAKNLFGPVEIKFLLLSVFYCYGAVSFFRKKNRGWIICAATLLNFIVVVLRYIIALSQSGNFNGFAVIVLSFFILLLLAFLLLFNRGTRIKFGVSNKSYLFIIVIYALLLVSTFTL